MRIGFILIRYPIHGLDSSSNPQFHCQNRFEPTHSFMNWIGFADYVSNEKYIYYDYFCRFKKNIYRTNKFET